MEPVESAFVAVVDLGYSVDGACEPDTVSPPLRPPRPGRTKLLSTS